MTIKPFLILALIFIFLYALLFEPNTLEIKHISFNFPKIKNLKIVFLSDFHLSKFSSRRLKKIVNKVNALNPDLILIAGDYTVMHSAYASLDLDKAVSIISKMNSKYGIYSVLGNHDYFKDGDFIKSKFKNSKIQILENSNVKLNINSKPLYIAGISDMQTTHYDLDSALKGVESPVILLSHSPDITPKAKDKVNLILSGHTHGGQVRIPFFGAVIVPSKYGKKYEYGLVDNIVYVTKGLGTSVLPLRFNCRPEITVIEFN